MASVVSTTSLPCFPRREWRGGKGMETVEWAGRPLWSPERWGTSGHGELRGLQMMAVWWPSCSKASPHSPPQQESNLLGTERFLPRSDRSTLGLSSILDPKHLLCAWQPSYSEKQGLYIGFIAPKWSFWVSLEGGEKILPGHGASSLPIIHMCREGTERKTWQCYSAIRERFIDFPWLFTLWSD